MGNSSGHKLSGGATLILGGIRSGKSVFGETLVRASALKPIYLATGRADDDEMRERIALHQERRNHLSGPGWETIEEPLALVDALHNCAYEGRAILVDCLTLWVTNLMMAGADVARESENLANNLDKFVAPVAFVSNEVGLSIIPENKMAREFSDHCGALHQLIAKKSQAVFFVAAGLPMVMKSPS